MPGPVTLARRREVLILFALAAFMLAAGLGLRDPWPADEPRFALVAKQMVDSGEYLFPRRGLELYSDKPPAYMWMQAAAYHVVGNWRIAFLLPSLLAALGTLVLVYDLARRLWTRRAGALATAALAGTLHFAFQARAAQIDPTVTFWITLSAYGLLRHLLLGPDWRWYTLGWFAAGLGVITKGVGFLALLLLLPYLYARWRGWRGLARIDRGAWRWVLGPLACLAAIALWLVPMAWVAYGSGDPALAAYADDILFRQTAQRFANPWHHVKPFWYFVPVIASLWLPVVLALPWAVPAWRRRLALRHDARVLLPLAWAALVVVFFSLSPGKRDVYILPALPMFCVALAPLLPGLLRRAGVQRLLFATTLALSAALLAVSLWALFANPPYARALESARGIAPWAMTASMGALALGFAVFARPRRGAVAWCGFVVVLWSLYGFWGYPLLNGSRSARTVMQRAGEIVGPEAELALVAYKEQNLLHADRSVTEFGFLRPYAEQRRLGVAWLRAAPKRRWLFILGDAMGACMARDRATHVGNANRREWFLVRADALVPDCIDRDDGSRQIPGDPIPGRS